MFEHLLILNSFHYLIDFHIGAFPFLFSRTLLKGKVLWVYVPLDEIPERCPG